MTDPGDPRPPYVTTDELAELVGADPTDPTLELVVADVTAVVDAYYGSMTVTARLAAPPWPANVRRAALTIAGDLWRRPATPGGYFQVRDYVGRLAQDPTSPVIVELNALGREAWPIG
jgi:hypothetical protein